MSAFTIENPLDGVRPSLGPLGELLGPILGVVALLAALAVLGLLWRDVRKARQWAATSGARRPRAFGWPRGWYLVAADLAALLGVFFLL